MNLTEFRTAVANELGLSVTDEVQTIDDALNYAVKTVLEDTHCYVIPGDIALTFNGVNWNFTWDAAILDVHDLFFTAADGTQDPLERVSLAEINRMRGVGNPGGPVRFYNVEGWNLLMFFPAPGASDVLTIFFVPVPTPMTSGTHDPSNVTYGGVPEVLHRGIFYRALADLASYDDDQSSSQGQRYREWYKDELTRYRTIIRKRGGNRNARARVNDGGTRRRYNHDNSRYPA